MAAPIGGPDISSSVLNLLRQSQASSQQSISRIASGNRITSAGDDPTASSISAQLRSEISSLSQAARNAATRGNFVRTAEGGFSGISNLISRGRELSVQSVNGTLSSEQRASLNAELRSINAEIERMAQSAEFNGRNFLNGNLAPGSTNQFNIQVGTSSGPESRINLNVRSGTTTH